MPAIVNPIDRRASAPAGGTPEIDSKSSQHLEVERKFDGIEAVATVRQEPTQTLSAVYFDTRVVTSPRTGSRCVAGREVMTPVGTCIASAEGADTEKRWREWELELAEDAIARGSADARLLKRLSERLSAAGAAPAGYPSKLARVLGTVSKACC